MGLRASLRIICVRAVEGRSLLDCVATAVGKAKAVEGYASAVGSTLSQSFVGVEGCEAARAKAEVSLLVLEDRHEVGLLICC